MQQESAMHTHGRSPKLESAEDLLASAYRLFNVRDIDGVLRLMHEDVDWPNAMDGTRIRGHEQVREYWKRQWAVVDPHVMPVSFATDDSGDTVVTVHQQVRDLECNILVDRTVEHVYTFQDGLIRCMEIREI
jgi:ketosteroid isomerase-like protein